MKTARNYFRSGTLFLCIHVLLACACGNSRADAGLEAMRGSNKYSSDTLSLDIKLSSSVSLGLADEQVVASTYTSLARTYSADLDVKLDKYFDAGANASLSPETDNTKSGGWGANLSYDSNGDDFEWALALPYSRTTLTDYWQANSFVTNARTGRRRTVTSAGSDDLTQSDFAPTLIFTLYGLVTLNFGDSQYSYDKDLSTFSANISRLSNTISTAKGARSVATKISFGSFPSLLYGFPERIYSAGVSVQLLDSLKAGFDWSRTLYALDQPEVKISSLSAAYTFSPALNAKASYQELSNKDTYTDAVISWVW